MLDAVFLNQLPDAALPVLASFLAARGRITDLEKELAGVKATLRQTEEENQRLDRQVSGHETLLGERSQEIASLNARLVALLASSQEAANATAGRIADLQQKLAEAFGEAVRRKSLADKVAALEPLTKPGHPFWVAMEIDRTIVAELIASLLDQDPTADVARVTQRAREIISQSRQSRQRWGSGGSAKK